MFRKLFIVGLLFSVASATGCTMCQNGFDEIGTYYGGFIDNDPLEQGATVVGSAYDQNVETEGEFSEGEIIEEGAVEEGDAEEGDTYYE